MWTYRPSDSSPMQQGAGFRSAAGNTGPAMVQQPSAPPVWTQNDDRRRPPLMDKKPQAVGAQQAGQKAQSIRTVPEVCQADRPARCRARPKPSRILRTACVMGSLYLVGIAAGAICSRFLSGPLLTYAQYFASTDLGLRTAGNAAMVFSVGFLSLFCQLTLVLISGFCVLGVGLIPVTMMLKGAGTGVFTALLYQLLGPAKGLLLQALVFWLPETLGSLLVILLSATAVQISGGLLRCCLGQGASSLGAASRRLLYRYLTVCFVSMLVCGLSVFLTLVFGSLF